MSKEQQNGVHVMVTDMENQVQSLEALDDDRELKARLVRKALKTNLRATLPR